MIQWAQKQKGFTIVELLIVVVVIAILAAITIVAYNGIQNRAKDSAAQSTAAQSAKKLAAYYALHADTYPTTLTDTELGLPNANASPSPYQYTVSADQKSFCLTTTTGAISYYVSQATLSPTKGGCDGHGVNGVAAITNYYPNPKPNSTSYAAYWDGGNAGSSYTNVSASWSQSGQANRIVFPSTIPNGSGGFTLNLGYSYAPYVGQRYTITASIRRISGTAGIGGLSIDKSIASSGAITVHATGGTNSSLNTGQTYKVYATFTADAAAADASQNLRFYINISNKSANTTVEVADIDLYPGDYNAARGWYSGDSQSWVWNGTANNATSTGPAS